MTSITEELLAWSENFLEKPNKDLGGWAVCPYAKAARLKDKVKIVEVDHRKDFLYTVSKEARTIKEQKKQLIIVACDDLNLTCDELDCYVEGLNYAFVYNDVYLMPFHPDDGDGEAVDFLTEHETNVEADYEFYMVLIQPYNELESASKLLHKKGYYDKWDKNYYRDTVIKRQTYRRVYYDGKKEKS